MDISPGSSNWRSLTGASAAYGLTIGAYNSDKISITDLAKKIIAPTVEGGEVLAKVEAMMKPEVLSKFFTKYNNAKLPKDTIIENVLREEFNVPKDRIQSVLQLIKDNGEFTGVFRETKTGTFILIDNPQPTEHDNNTGEVTSPSEEIPKELAEKLDISWRHLQRLEHNESNTTVKTLKKLIKVLKISDKDILDYLKNDTGFYEDKD